MAETTPLTKFPIKVGTSKWDRLEKDLPSLSSRGSDVYVPIKKGERFQIIHAKKSAPEHWWNAIRLSDGQICVVQKNYFDVKVEQADITMAQYKFAKNLDEEGNEITTGLAGLKINPTSCGQVKNELYFCKGKGCSKSSVWGSGPFTSDSAKCTAARHQGLVKADVGGYFKLKTFGARQSFSGSTANGITTSNFGPWNSCYMLYPEDVDINSVPELPEEVLPEPVVRSVTQATEPVVVSHDIWEHNIKVGELYGHEFWRGGYNVGELEGIYVWRNGSRVGEIEGNKFWLNSSCVAELDGRFLWINNSCDWEFEGDCAWHRNIKIIEVAGLMQPDILTKVCVWIIYFRD